MAHCHAGPEDGRDGGRPSRGKHDSYSGGSGSVRTGSDEAERKGPVVSRFLLVNRVVPTRC